jgi:hypothetical protein
MINKFIFLHPEELIIEKSNQEWKLSLDKYCKKYHTKVHDKLYNAVNDNLLNYHFHNLLGRKIAKQSILSLILIRCPSFKKSSFFSCLILKLAKKLKGGIMGMIFGLIFSVLKTSLLFSYIVTSPNIQNTSILHTLSKFFGIFIAIVYSLFITLISIVLNILTNYKHQDVFYVAVENIKESDLNKNKYVIPSKKWKKIIYLLNFEMKRKLTRNDFSKIGNILISSFVINLLLSFLTRSGKNISKIEIILINNLQSICINLIKSKIIFYFMT